MILQQPGLVDSDNSHWGLKTPLAYSDHTLDFRPGSITTIPDLGPLITHQGVLQLPFTGFPLRTHTELHNITVRRRDLLRFRTDALTQCAFSLWKDKLM